MEQRFRIEVMCDRHGFPSYAVVYMEQEDGQVKLLADEDFGPHCTKREVLTWANRVMLDAAPQ